jgi:hypothetical protein
MSSADEVDGPGAAPVKTKKAKKARKARKAKKASKVSRGAASSGPGSSGTAKFPRQTGRPREQVVVTRRLPPSSLLKWCLGRSGAY